MQEFGPVQILMLGFQGGKFSGEIIPELRRLREQDIVRLVDLLFVTKDADGNLASMEHSDFSAEEFQELGALTGALVGFGAEGEEGLEEGAEAGAEAAASGTVFSEDEIWDVADAIPPGSSAAIALIEHRWAIPLRDAIGRAGGFTIADEWVHPNDLIAAGQTLAARPTR
jgi:uncharacterized membrane protein